MYKGEKEILEFLLKMKSANVQSTPTVEEIANQTGLNIDTVRRAVESLRMNGYLSIDIVKKGEFGLTEEGNTILKLNNAPEFKVFKKSLEGTGIEGLSDDEKMGLGWAKKKGFIKIENGRLIPLKSLEEVEKERKHMMNTLSKINNEDTDDQIRGHLISRKMAVFKPKEDILIQLSPEKNSDIQKLLQNEEFDITTETRDAELGKNHPLTKLTRKIKGIFTELGFEEMDGDIVETSFWNFDALFQPQDHPSRDLADTFYLKGEGKLPDKNLVQRVKEAHEQSWKYKWKESEAKRLVLRTHTTALSARYLAALKNKEPKKYFSIGRVFRNEATDYSHLAEFHQVDGIIAWEKATFRDLLGIIKEFYGRLGFEKIRFRPSYFPYTEPSLEIEIYYEPKKTWLEIGGAGIFRPEVSMPLCGVYPVLAWGLSLERPLMLALGVEDIRTFYKNDMDFLRNTRL